MVTRLVGIARRREDGAAAVEFAIVAPLLFMLVFGIIQFGIFFAQDLALSNGARQGARAGAVPTTGTCGDIYDEVQQGAGTIALDPDNVLVTVSIDGPGANVCPDSSIPPDGIPDDPALLPCEGTDAGSQLFVQGRFEANLIIPLAFARSVTLDREGSYRCEFS